MKHQTQIFSLSLIVLGGCATTNTPEEINYYSEVFHYSNLCANAQLMDLDTAARGKVMAMSNIYRQETGRVQAKVSELISAGSRADKKTCDVLASLINATKPSTTQASNQATSPAYAPMVVPNFGAAVAPSQPFTLNPPKFGVERVMCKKVGENMFCK
ncbi:hypothetical protein [Polaromonas sp.]|uniref:hypothetical protein n=1 Tax=Polaromonas sp. TaxID=1869339 RepID=UPI00248909CE|nr:hypothetical protein [Polaromonas sp.]MDI1272341.1 hypothetical protein [Polaromonas sp.]